MKERLFIRKAKSQIGLEEFIKSNFQLAKFGDIEVQNTPVGTRIIIYTVTPGLVIGSGGERIRELSDEIKEKFGIANPQIDVQKILNPDINPSIIAKNIALAIENNVNYKRLGNHYVSRIMKAGAVGCEIVLSGKFSGQRGRTERFIAGYLKKCGEPSERDVLKGFAVANPKLGNVGISVKIMIKPPSQPLKRKAEKSEAATVAEEEKIPEKESTGEENGNNKNEESEATE
ncbi:MAG: 30S ribosomal protein S3 [Candidatus Aenigmarchaeota archaeon]|nr:30S ribosomal protein S3 [Candidatus Aenigmarchaeota archaeon]